jgi:uncharacterized OsmC-like protein
VFRERVPSTTFQWAVRVHRIEEQVARVYARNHAFTVGEPASFKETDRHPSATELLLGALGADLVNGFSALARRRSIEIEGLELTLAGELDNPLVHLGVIGESGHSGFASIQGTFHVRVDAPPATAEEIWRQTLERSPMWNTLVRSVELQVELRLA